MDRILQELVMHTRLSGGVSKSSLVLDYGEVLRDHVVSPLVVQRPRVWTRLWPTWESTPS